MRHGTLSGPTLIEIACNSMKMKNPQNIATQTNIKSAYSNHQ